MRSITVVVVSYNYVSFISQALDSLISQERLPDRILAVDDGAHDGAMEIAQWYGKKYGLVETLEREENMGVVANFDDILRNRVSTEMVMFLGADNWLRPDALAKMDIDGDIISSDLYYVGVRAKHMISHKKVRVKSEYKDGYWIRRFSGDSKHINMRNEIHGSSLYNVKLAQRFGYRYLENKGEIFDKTRPLEDWQLWKDMIKKGGAKHVHVPEPLLYYRRHDGNYLKIFRHKVKPL